MAKLKIRVELNKGRIGIPLDKLASVVAETEKFLAMLSADVGISSPQWLGSNFQNNSVDFDCECLVADDATRDLGYRALKGVMSNQEEDKKFCPSLRPATIRQYAMIAKPIDPDEKIRFGVFNGKPEPAWFDLTKELALQVSEQTPQFGRYYGEIQGIIHAFYKESDSPKIVVRELSSRALIDCFFDKKNPQMYGSAIDLMKDRDAVIFVEGDIVEDLDEGVVRSVTVKDFRLAPKFDLLFFEKSIGGFPDLTGEKSTDEFIEGMREDADT